jgi:hypothetical protein
MTDAVAGSWFQRVLLDSYQELSSQGLVQVDEGGADPRGEVVTRIHPAEGHNGPRIELRAQQSTADLFIDDLEPFEIREEAEGDRKDFAALIKALVAGGAGIRQVRGLRGWKTSAIVWSTGEWEIGRGIGIPRQFLSQRHDPLPKYL